MATPAYVYLIGVRDGLYKIGYSEDPLRRLTQMPGYYEHLAIIGCFPASDPRGVERHLHQAFRVRRVHGEWFHLTLQHVAAWPADEAAAMALSPFDDHLPDPHYVPEWLLDAERTRVTFDLPEPVRRAIAICAAERSVTVGQVIEAMATETIPEFIARAEKAIAAGDIKPIGKGRPPKKKPD